MDDRKIYFIMCANDEQYVQEVMTMPTTQTVSKEQITLVLTGVNRTDILQNCLDWLCTLPEVHRVIFVDNVPADGSSEADSIVFDGRQGYGIIWNAAIHNINELDDVIVFMDVRYRPGKNCLKELYHALQSERVGIAGPRSNGCSVCQYVAMERMEAALEMETQADSDVGIWYAVDLDAGIWAISRRTLEEAGDFRSELLLPQNVLLDYELRIIRKGYRPVICKNAFAFFIGAEKDKFPESDKCKDRNMLKQYWNMNYFMRKPNCNLTGMIKAAKDDAIRVLEVGCDLGATLLDIKNHYPNSSIHGLEINPAAVEIASHLADIRQGNIEEEQVTFREKFDYIIFGDVLEHLHDPWKTIRFCREKLLKSTGEIIANIPNLMHISVMQQVLQGRFEYTDMGLLDRTHIHFFTFYEIIQMFQSAGYRIEELQSIKFSLEPEQERLIEKLLELSENAEPHMYETFWYLIRAGVKD